MRLALLLGTALLCACQTPYALSKAAVEAAERGDDQALKAALAKGGRPAYSYGWDGRRYQGTRHAIAEAVSRNRLSTVKVLLDAGADPNAGGALDEALDKPEIARLLLERGADPFRGHAFAFARAGDRARIHPEVARLVMAAADRLRPETPRPASAAPLAETRAFAGLKPSYSFPERADDYAVVIGVENYTDLPPATGAERDAAAAKEFIRALGVPERNISYLTGSRATKTGLLKNLETWLSNHATEKSRVIVYYSGHGAPDPASGDAYLLPVDGDPQYLSDTGYPLKRLYDSMGKLKARQVLVLLDSCFSGAGGRSVLPKGTRPLVAAVNASPAPDAAPNLVALTASAGNQISGTDAASGHGLFTRYLLEGMNEAARNAAGRLTARALHDYLLPRVQDEAKKANREQTPQFRAVRDFELR